MNFGPKTLIQLLLALMLIGCATTNKTPSLSEKLQAYRSKLAPFLPRMADDETRLDSVEVRENELWFRATLIHTSRSEFDLDELSAALEKELRAEAQRVAELRDLLIQGATLVYAYEDKHHADVTTIKITGDQPKPAQKLDLTRASKDAAEFLEKHVALEWAFDPSIADLYSDDAVIRNTRRYPDGNTRIGTMPAAAYKKLIRDSMPLARERGDLSSYTDVSSKEEATGIRITATRFSELKKYSSPLSMLIAPRDGQWLIVEEISESRP